MKDKAIEFMDAISAVLEHPLVGLLVWIAIAVLNEAQEVWAVRAVAGLMIVKTYLSSSWDRKRGVVKPEEAKP